MRTAASVIMAITLSWNASAQGMGEIHGKVLDDMGPVPGAMVVAGQGERRVSTTTDIDGRFVLKPLPAGAYAVVVSMTGMQRQELAGVIVTPDNNSYVEDVTLLPLELGTVEVVKKKWEKPNIQHDNTGVIQIFHTQFKNSPVAKSPITMISSYSPGVYKAPNGDGLFFRGSRSENMCYFVDGVKLGDRLSALPNNAINSFSVYTGGLPAKYGDVTGGVVAIETKSYFDLWQQRNAGIK